MSHISEVIAQPADWGERYTEEDRALTHQVIEILNSDTARERGWSRANLARRAGIAQSTLHMLLAGTYAASPTQKLRAALSVLERDAARMREGVQDVPYVETSVHRAVYAACKRAHLYRNFGVVSAFVGTGKTRAVKHYADQHHGAVLIEASPEMTGSVLLDQLIEATGAPVRAAHKYSRGTKAERMAAVLRALKGTDSLLILDEAETVTAGTLEIVRRIRDLAGIGVVLSGTERLLPMIRDPRGRFGQISSRVGFWPPVIRGITEADAHALARAALASDVDTLDEPVLNALWQVCDGSARVLCEGLIPGVRDYGLKQGHALSPELIFKVGQDVLGFRPARRGA